MGKSTETNEIAVAGGTIEFETVGCAICDQQVLVSDAVSLVIGGEITHEWRSIGKINIEGVNIDSAAVCPYCAESVFDYSEKSDYFDRNDLRKYRLVATLMDNFWIVMMVLCGISFALSLSDLLMTP